MIFDGDTQLLHQVTGTGPDFVDTKVGDESCHDGGDFPCVPWSSIHS